MKSLLAISFAILLPVVCNSAAAKPLRHSATSSWPLSFFAGHTKGEGSLRVLFRPIETIDVFSRGRINEAGTLVLRQTIRQGDKAPTTREWRLRQVGAGRYVGTLTDAAGPVTGEATANRLQLCYTLKGDFRLQIEQRLELQPDGRTIRNLLIARKFGIPIASLRETIRKMR